ncbi:MAG: transglutaminase domain-containing protein [Candidatus Omnitrophica bacterium]|nr:transglutaminase domain-containing protein [Candidatus Omnitrophota bacterium]
MRSGVRTLAIDGLILTFWLSSVGAVVVRECGVWGGRVGSLRLFPGASVITEQWFGVYYQDRKVGFTHTVVTPDTQRGVPGHTLFDHSRLRMSVLGTPQILELRARAFTDADSILRSLLVTVQAEGYHLQLDGQRHGDDLRLTLSSPSSSVTHHVYDPSGRLVVSGLSSWAVFHELRVGQHGRLWIVNPLALKPETIDFHVRRMEQFHNQKALVVESDYQGLTATTWITPGGVVLKESSLMGWTLVQEPMEQAIAMNGREEPALDLLSTVAVPIDQPLGDVAVLRRLTLLVEGVASRACKIDRRPWQEALPDETLATYGVPPPPGPWCIIRLSRPDRSMTPQALAMPEPRYAKPSPFIQSDDPLIRAQALAVVGPLTDPWPQAIALSQWVYQTLTKQLTIGLPSARDVLVSKRGDCHEHTVLFTALARSVGIPTRMVAGLVYYHDRFYYHAWPEVWSASQSVWMPIDPTLGQVVADVAHLGLVEAENEELVSLAQFVGKIRLRMLEAVDHHP